MVLNINSADDIMIKEFINTSIHVKEKNILIAKYFYAYENIKPFPFSDYPLSMDAYLDQFNPRYKGKIFSKLNDSRGWCGVVSKKRWTEYYKDLDLLTIGHCGGQIFSVHNLCTFFCNHDLKERKKEYFLLLVFFLNEWNYASIVSIPKKGRSF
ncbi:hypothetical protein H8356DRAFT_1332404 [Neocallimastix lanati (nom. inval.)]|nr:hypothetical protein H8356DRAFT_1332404 [Neocallimastix sp. JGI-2020a]